MSMKRDILAFKYGNRAVEGEKKDPGEMNVHSLGLPAPSPQGQQLTLWGPKKGLTPSPLPISFKGDLGF